MQFNECVPNWALTRQPDTTKENLRAPRCELAFTDFVVAVLTYLATQADNTCYSYVIPWVTDVDPLTFLYTRLKREIELKLGKNISQQLADIFITNKVNYEFNVLTSDIGDFC